MRNNWCGTSNVVKTLGPSKKVYTSSLGWERAALPSQPASGCGQAAEFIYGKQKRPPGRASPKRASGFLVRRRLCQRVAGGLWSPRIHRTAYRELIAPLSITHATTRSVAWRHPLCISTGFPPVKPKLRPELLLPTSLVHAFHTPSHSFVLGHLRRTSEGVHIVGEVPKLLILEREEVCGHGRPIEPGEDTSEDVARRRSALERSAGEVGRLHRKVWCRGAAKGTHL